MVCVIVVEVGGGAQVWSQSEPIRESVRPLVIEVESYEE